MCTKNEDVYKELKMKEAEEKKRRKQVEREKKSQREEEKREKDQKKRGGGTARKEARNTKVQPKAVEMMAQAFKTWSCLVMMSQMLFARSVAGSLTPMMMAYG